MTKAEALQKAENGNIDAILYLISYYTSSEINLQEAEKWARKAADTGEYNALSAAATFFSIRAHMDKQAGAAGLAEEAYIQSLYYIQQLSAVGIQYPNEAQVREELADLYYHHMNRMEDAVRELEYIKNSGRPYAALMLEICHRELGMDKDILDADIRRIEMTIENDGWPKLSLKGIAYSALAVYYVYEKKEPFTACNCYRKSAEMWNRYLGDVEGEISFNMPISEMKKVFDKTDVYYSQYRDICNTQKSISDRIRQGQKNGNASLSILQWVLVIALSFTTCFVGIILYFYFRNKNRNVKPSDADQEMIKRLDEVAQEMLTKGMNTGIAQLIPKNQLQPEMFDRIYQDFRNRNRELYE